MAAVHYHFGSKEKLYEAVLRHAPTRPCAAIRRTWVLTRQHPGAQTRGLRPGPCCCACWPRARPPGTARSWPGDGRAHAHAGPVRGSLHHARAEILRRIVAGDPRPHADPFLIGLCTQCINRAMPQLRLLPSHRGPPFPELTFDEQGVGNAWPNTSPGFPWRPSKTITARTGRPPPGARAGRRGDTRRPDRP